LQESSLWQAFENGYRPFSGAVVLGDSAYPCRDWLIPPFSREQGPAHIRFNTAHMKTRNTVERTFGLLKKRFYALQTTMRVKNMELAGKLVICAAVLHNLCISHGDFGEDLNPGQVDPQPPPDPPGNGDARDLRRQQLLQFFS
jgi:hypothetical protein